MYLNHKDLQYCTKYLIFLLRLMSQLSSSLKKSKVKLTYIWKESWISSIFTHLTIFQSSFKTLLLLRQVLFDNLLLRLDLIMHFIKFSCRWFTLSNVISHSQNSHVQFLPFSCNICFTCLWMIPFLFWRVLRFLRLIIRLILLLWSFWIWHFHHIKHIRPY